MGTEDHRWHYDYVRLAWDAGFSFDKYKYPNMDKNKICLVDIDRIIKERDVASVERFLSTVVQYVLENDQAELLDTNFVKMFRLSQLSVEYLLFCKKYLDKTVVLLKKDVLKLKEENKELKLFTEELESHISALTKQSYVTTFKCEKCSKAFSTEEYLISHAKRRHTNESKSSTNTETDQLQSEIKQLKERLNVAEKLLQEKDKQVQNVKMDSNENENKLKVEEVLEKFEKFKEKVENDLKMLQVEKNFYEEKYSKLFDVVFDSNRKDNTNMEIAEKTQAPSKENEEKLSAEDNIDKIETTTQTERELKMETVHEKNVYEFKDQNELESLNKENKIQDTIEQKISEFEEQIELKISSGLINIEKQMQAFWGRLSEIQIRKESNIVSQEGDGSSPRHEIVQIEQQSKPKIKPRMKLSKPTALISANEGHAELIKAEIEKMSFKKPKVAAVAIHSVEENKSVKIPDIMYDTSPVSDSETKSESESMTAENIPKKSKESKISRSTLEKKRSSASSRKTTNSKISIEKIREEIKDELNEKLQDIGVSPHWKGIPQKTFEKALEIIQHQASRVKKSYSNFDTIKKSIMKKLESHERLKQKRLQDKISSNKKQTNIVNIKYKKKRKESESDLESRPPVITIKNRSLYDIDTDSEKLERQPTKVSEAVPTYSAVVKELKATQSKSFDTDSDVNSFILPKEDDKGTKGVLKNCPSLGSLTKKKVLFDIESENVNISKGETKRERRDSTTTADSSDNLKMDVKEKKEQEHNSSLSDFDLS